jgi:hypothetical protein
MVRSPTCGEDLPVRRIGGCSCGGVELSHTEVLSLLRLLKGLHRLLPSPAATPGTDMAAGGLSQHRHLVHEPHAGEE